MDNCMNKNTADFIRGVMGRVSHDYPIDSIALHENFIIGAHGNGVRLWDLTAQPSSAVLLGDLYEHTDYVIFVTTVDNHRTASMSRDGQVQLFDLENRNVLFVFHTHKGANVNTVASKDNLLVTGSLHGAFVWDLNTGLLLYNLPPHPVQCVAVGGNIIATSSGHRTPLIVPVYNLQKGELLTELAHESQVRTVTANETYILTGTKDNATKIWTHNGICLNSLQSSGNSARMMLFESNQLLRECAGQLEYWDLSTLKRVRSHVGHKDRIRSVAASPSWFLSSGDFTIRVWCRQTGKCILILGETVTYINKKGHARRLAVVSWDIEKKTEVWRSLDGTTHDTENTAENIVPTPTPTPTTPTPTPPTPTGPATNFEKSTMPYTCAIPNDVVEFKTGTITHIEKSVPSNFMDMTKFLSDLNLISLLPTFEKEDIDFEVLVEMTEADLTSVGISFGHRKKLLKALTNLPAWSPSSKTLPFDVFLTHDWGVDKLGRNNHNRVAEIHLGLKKRGLRPWFDSERMTGRITKQMTDGIDSSHLVIVFVTERYQNKIDSDDTIDDNCKFEFDYAIGRKKAAGILCVVMEPHMHDSSAWKGPLGGHLGRQLYVSASGDITDAVLDKICAEIKVKFNKQSN
eukprot:Lithocolla_globosa_v1_NODE_29_length_9070_cov_27.690371.p2 type:complete len:630 gc:universal NODE_29_length_9070_cov_27.690371:3318-1429(-)